jgi:anti-sigma regulatory factor (Ser/Thr protein kinase)
VRAFVADAIRGSALSERQQTLLVLATDEAVTSIIRHAVRVSGGSGNGLCHVTVDVDATRVRVVIDDSGADSDLTGLSDAALREHIAAGRSEEIGIFLIRAIVDEINYVYRKGFQNQFEMVKFIFAETPPDGSPARYTAR